MLGQSSASNALRCRSELWAVTRHTNLVRTAHIVRNSTNDRTADVRVEHGFDSNTKLIPTGDPTIGIKLFCRREFTKTPGYSLKLEEKRFNLKLRRGFFTVRAARMWNSLPQAVVSAGSIDSFKKLLDNHLNDRNIQGYVM